MKLSLIAASVVVYTALALAWLCYTEWPLPLQFVHTGPF